MLPGRHRGPPAQLEVSAHASTTPLSRRRPCARAPKAEVSRKLCVGGGASSAVLPFRRRRACSATPPVAGCGSPSPGVDSALLPRLACLRVHGCKPLGFRCCVQRARGQRAVSSWAREGWGSPGVGLSRDGGTSPLPLPERGDPQAVQEQPRFLTPGCCLRRAVRSGQSGGPAPTSRDSVRRGPAPRVFKLQPLMYPRLPVPLERETPGAAVTDLSAGGRNPSAGTSFLTHSTAPAAHSLLQPLYLANLPCNRTPSDSQLPLISDPITDPDQGLISNLDRCPKS